MESEIPSDNGNVASDGHDESDDDPDSTHVPLDFACGANVGMALPAPESKLSDCKQRSGSSRTLEGKARRSGMKSVSEISSEAVASAAQATLDGTAAKLILSKAVLVEPEQPCSKSVSSSAPDPRVAVSVPSLFRASDSFDAAAGPIGD